MVWRSATDEGSAGLDAQSGNEQRRHAAEREIYLCGDEARQSESRGGRGRGTRERGRSCGFPRV